MSDRLPSATCMRASASASTSRRVCSDADPGFLLNIEAHACVGDRFLPSIHIPYTAVVCNLLIICSEFHRVRLFYSLQVRAHLIGLKNICFQKIKNQSFHLIGRSVSTPRMVILIFRKFCFQPRSPGGLFLRNYICFIRSSCGVPHRVSQTSSHSTGTSISPETHTRTHGQARTAVACRGRCPTRRRTNR